LYIQIKPPWTELISRLKVGGQGSEQMVMKPTTKLCSVISGQIGRSFEFARNFDDLKWAAFWALSSAFWVEILIPRNTRYSVSKPYSKHCPCLFFGLVPKRCFFWSICKSNVFCLMELMPIHFKMFLRRNWNSLEHLKSLMFLIFPLCHHLLFRLEYFKNFTT